MSQTSDEECPFCDQLIRVPLEAYVEGKVVTCPHCQRQSRLSELPSPTAGNLLARVWHLLPGA
jgi:uncharacterized Zn-finger protein